MKKTLHNAFTMLELVFVIVVMAIIAVVLIPRSESTNVREAAIQLVTHIRYTQHLAMVDDKFNSANANWYRNRWQIAFNGNQYDIVSDNGATFARDPMNNTTMQNINLATDYSVVLGFSADCGAPDAAGNIDISFDHLGRPLIGDISDDVSAYIAGQLIPNTNTCDITITDTSNPANFETISIEQETGYTRID